MAIHPLPSLCLEEGDFLPNLIKEEHVLSFDELTKEQLDELEKICSILDSYRDNIYGAIKRRKLDTLEDDSAILLRHLLRCREDQLLVCMQNYCNSPVYLYSIDYTHSQLTAMAKEKEVINSLFELL